MPPYPPEPPYVMMFVMLFVCAVVLYGWSQIARLVWAIV